MQSIDETRLDSDLQYRYEYLCDFVQFGAEDFKRIQAFAPHLGPRIGELVERTYERLLQYDATARHFVPQQSGCADNAPENASDLTLDHPHIVRVIETFHQ